MRTRLIIGLIAAASSFSVAQANPAAIVGGVVASAVGSAIANRNQPKLASCTLYDQEGRPVTVSCPADVPGAVAAPTKGKHGKAGPELAGGPPPAYAPQYDAAPPAQMTYLSGGLPDAHCLSCTAIAPPPPPPPPAPRGDCDCDGPGPGYGAAHREDAYRYDDARPPRAGAALLGGSSYRSYEESREHVSGSYEEQYGYGGGYAVAGGGYGSRYSSYGDGAGYTGAYGQGYAGGGYGQAYGQTYGQGYASGAAYGGGYGQGYGYESGYASGAGIGWGQEGGVGGYASYGAAGGGFFPYGGYGYQNGGYADGYGYRARVSGRDPNGFLTWPGKR